MELDVTGYYNKDSAPNQQELISKIKNTITEYSKSKDLNSFGGRFKYSKLISIIDNTHQSITSNITKVTIRRNLNPAFNLLANYELCFGNQFHIGKTNYNIKSSGFTILNSSDTLYLSDSVNSDGKTGRIFFFKLVNNSPVIVVQNAGTVDYVKGEVLLSPVVFTSSANTDGIYVQAYPESNDVIAYKDIYLELSIPNTKVSVVEDTLTSGENTSGTLYKTTSSYSNGNFIR